MCIRDSRLLLIPLIVFLYVGKELYGWTLVVLIISLVTDIIDGLVAVSYTHLEISSFNIIGDGADDVIVSTLESRVGAAYGFFNLGLKEKEVKTELKDGSYTNVLTNTDIVVNDGKIKVSEPIIIIEE